MKCLCVIWVVRDVTEVVGLGWFHLVFVVAVLNDPLRIPLAQFLVCVMASWERRTIDEVVVLFFCRIANISKFTLVTV